MRYENLKTGAIVDSSFKIFGGDWVLYDSKKEPVETPSVEKAPQAVEIPEENTGNADFDSITKPQIMQELDAFGVKYDKRATKQVLYDLMMSHGQ